MNVRSNNFKQLNDYKGLTLCNVLFQSFYLNGIEVQKYNRMFFQFGEGNLSISIGDGEVLITIPDSVEEKERSDSDFDYPVFKVEKTLVEKYDGQKLVGYNKLVWKENMDDIYGVILIFEKDEMVFFEDKNEDICILSKRSEIPDDLIVVK